MKLFFFKIQGTRLGAIVAPNKCTVFFIETVHCLGKKRNIWCFFCYLLSSYEIWNYFFFAGIKLPSNWTVSYLFLVLSEAFSHSNLFYCLAKKRSCNRSSPLQMSLFNKVTGPQPTQVFSCEYCEIFKNSLFYRTPLVAASVRFMWLFIFYTIWKYQTTSDFLMLSGGIERDRWNEMGYGSSTHRCAQ